MRLKNLTIRIGFNARHFGWVLAGATVGWIGSFFVLSPLATKLLLPLQTKQTSGSKFWLLALAAEWAILLGAIGSFGCLFHFLERGSRGPQSERRRRASWTAASLLGFTLVGLGLVIAFRYPIWRQFPSQGIALVLSCDPLLLGNTQSQVEMKLGKPPYVSGPWPKPAYYHVWHYPFGNGMVALDVAFDEKGNVRNVSPWFFD